MVKLVGCIFFLILCLYGFNLLLLWFSLVFLENQTLKDFFIINSGFVCLLFSKVLLIGLFFNYYNIIGDFLNKIYCALKTLKMAFFPAAQLESDDLLKMSNLSFSRLKSDAYGFYKGLGLENFINRTRYLVLTPKGGPLVWVCIG